MLVYVLTNF